MDEVNLSRHLLRAVMLYLCFEEGRFTDLKIEKPVPDDDQTHGQPNEGLCHIFDAWVHDPSFDKRKKSRDAVADGNLVLTRLLCEDEKMNLKRLTKGPKGKRIAKRPAASPTKSRSRCVSVAKQEKWSQLPRKMKRTSGIYGTVDMRTGEILQLSEMLNAECKAYKKDAAALVRRHVRIGVLCLDCACTCTDFEKVYCNRCLLDAWHAKGHKCSRAKFDPQHRKNQAVVRGCNSEAAEQLWSRTDKLAPFASHFGRGAFRLFLRAYCRWRNNYKRAGLVSDTSGCVSRKTRKRRAP